MHKITEDYDETYDYEVNEEVESIFEPCEENDDDFYDEDDRYEDYDEDYDDYYDDYYDEDYYYEELNKSYEEDNFVCQRAMTCPYNCEDCDYEHECTMCENDGSFQCDTCIHRERCDYNNDYDE